MATGEGATPAPKPSAKAGKPTPISSAKSAAKTATAKNTAPKVKAERKPKAAKVGQECGCGCKGTTKGGRFLPGHDARFHSAQKKAAEAKSGKPATAKAAGADKPPTPPKIAESAQPSAE